MMIYYCYTVYDNIYHHISKDLYIFIPSFSVSSAPTDLWESTGQEVASALRALGLLVGPVVTMETQNKGGPREALEAIREADKVKGQSSHHFLG